MCAGLKLNNAKKMSQRKRIKRIKFNVSFCLERKSIREKTGPGTNNKLNGKSTHIEPSIQSEYDPRTTMTATSHIQRAHRTQNIKRNSQVAMGAFFYIRLLVYD